MIASDLSMGRLTTRAMCSIFLFATMSCVAQMGGSTRPYYHEDLQYLRPKYPEPNVDTLATVIKKGEVIPRENVNKQVDAVLDSINRFTVTRKYVDGFTILIYSGQNREEAMNTKKKMTTDAGDLNAELEYTQPRFRVRVGGYFSRLEAQKDLTRLKRLFPNAILVPEKIFIK